MPGPAIDLSGKTALVTGASRGIGQAIADCLATAGARVIGVGTRIEDAPARAGIVPVNCDLSDRAAIARLVDRMDDAGETIDILVNNAGIIRREGAATHDIADWDAVMAVNLDAVFLLAQAFGKRMVARGSGKIINLASVLSFQGGILVPGYAASKGAIAQLTKSLANEWAAHGVNVNAIAPGYIATDNTAALQADPDRTAALMARVPAGRWGRPEEIAWPIAFLASDLANFMHGEVMVVDGGWMAR